MSTITRRTQNPVTREEARRILSAPVRDVEYARLAASYLDLLDAFSTATREPNFGGWPANVDEFFTIAEDDPE